MKTPKHTPGPWNLRPNRLLKDGSLETYEVISNNGLAVALPLGGLSDKLERLTNARLISAAPELLQACIDAGHAVEDRIITTDIGWAKIIIKLRSAIGKAAGIVTNAELERVGGELESIKQKYEISKINGALLEALQNLVARDLIKDANGEHFEEVLAAIHKATKL